MTNHSDVPLQMSYALAFLRPHAPAFKLGW
jgi:hypothetical protein